MENFFYILAFFYRTTHWSIMNSVGW